MGMTMPPLQATNPWFPPDYGSSYIADLNPALEQMDGTESFNAYNNLSWEEALNYTDGSSLPDVSVTNETFQLTNFDCTSNENIWAIGPPTDAGVAHIENGSYFPSYDGSLPDSHQYVPQLVGSRGELSTSPRSSLNDSDRPQKNTDKSQPRTKPSLKGKRGKKSTKDEHMVRMCFLANNRRAASKCRAKKRSVEEELQHHAHILTSENAQLNLVKIALTHELLHLKAMLLGHIDCTCVDIREYLKEACSKMKPNKEVHRMCCSN